MTRSEYTQQPGFEPLALTNSVSARLGINQGIFGFLHTDDGKIMVCCYDIAYAKVNTFETTTEGKEAIIRWATGELYAHQTGLSEDERELCMTGINSDDWDPMFPDEDEEDE
jgi:hypothetical protein